MSCERALNFDHLKTFSENYKPMRVLLWLVYKFTKTNCRLQLSENLLLAKYLISVTATLSILKVKISFLNEWKHFAIT